MNHPIFQVDHLSLAYPGRRGHSAAPILNDISFTMERGRALTLAARRDRASRRSSDVSTVLSSRHRGWCDSTAAPTGRPSRSRPGGKGAATLSRPLFEDSRSLIRRWASA